MEKNGSISGQEVNGLKKNLFKISWPLVGLFLISMILLLERTGIRSHFLEGEEVSYSKLGTAVFSAPVEVEKECIIIMDSENEVSSMYFDIMSVILKSMSVGFDYIDVSQSKIESLEKYQTMVICISDLSKLGENLSQVLSWVKNGGRLMNAYTYEPGKYFNILSDKMGIKDGGRDYSVVEGIKVKKDFMLGADRTFRFGSESESALVVLLDEKSNIYIEEASTEVPLLWERDYGEGKFVVMNMEEHGKTNRGILSSAYSLLQDAFVYPVINGSAYYIDDFPAPIPEGTNQFVTRDYQTSVSDFYMNIWWPDVLGWEKDYWIKHTGMIIEDYSDIVEEPFPQIKETERFRFFGTMLLNYGGELGLHGYNHMPLCLDGFDFKGLYNYKTFKNERAIKASIEELYRFSKQQFPSQSLSVYVPPSNVLSEEGRRVISNNLSNVKIIASVYLPMDDGCEHVQEFGIGKDGLIDTPRITSGCYIDDFMQFAAFSELNFHFVQSHFLHPDDALDEDRGAELGWEYLENRFRAYLQWVEDSAPGIRNLTGSEMGEAVEVYDNLSVRRTINEDRVELELGGFSDEAYFIMRLNDADQFQMDGATAEKLTGDLYLIKAINNHVEITW